MNFQEQYNRLNPKQRLAVDTIFGPVLVIAGPGTGKTQVLTMRIANILQKTDIDPQNILAITFTENASVEMQERLIKLIGPTAYNVNIFTFHGFCNEIILSNPEKFLFAQKLEAIDEITKFQIIKNILEKNNYKYLSPINAPNFFIRDIIRSISDLKREGFSYDEFLKLAEKEKQSFEEIPKEVKNNQKTGKMKQDYIKMEKKINKWFELADIMKKLQEETQKKGFFDFDDMIMLVLEQLQKDEDLVLALREKYQFFLVDEFQDTNGAQFQLLKNILEPENPNIFAVGDADQAIYRFQGASLENILLFSNNFPTTRIINLQTNYRSTKEIVNLAMDLIKNNQERHQKLLDKQEDFVIHAHNDQSGQITTFYSYDNEQSEYYFTMKKITQLLSQGIKPEEIAIVFRKNFEGEKWLNYLEKNNIPASFKTQNNIFNNQKIKQFITILKLINQPENSSLFFKVLHFDFLEISIAEIWKIWEQARKHRQEIWEYILETYNEEINQTQLFSSDHNSTVNHFFRVFFDWQKDKYNMELTSLLKKVASESKLIETIIQDNDFDLETLNLLNSLFNEAERQQNSNTHINLEEFVQNLQLLEEFKLSLTKKNNLQKNTIQLLTAHGAKGLEFEYVFIPNVSKGNWGDSSNRNGIKLPENIMEFPCQESQLEEERRLFFVAITRAKSNLILSYHKQNLNQQEKITGRFLSEFPGDLIENIIGESLENDQKIIADLQYVTTDRINKNRELLKEKISYPNFALSHTAFENFRICMRKGLFENIIYAPREKATPLALGSAIHKGLEVYFKKMQIDKRLPDISIAIDAFHNKLNKEKIDQQEKDKIQKEGENLITEYLEENKDNFKMPASIELDFRSHGIFLNKQIPLTGKIDKVEFIDQNQRTVKVIDYKVSKPKSENEIRGNRNSDKINPSPGTGTNYRQLLFFAILAEESPRFNYNIEKFELQFLKPGDNGKLTFRQFIPNNNEINELKTEIQMIWDKIQKLDFPKVPECQKKTLCEKAGAGGKDKCPFMDICWNE